MDALDRAGYRALVGLAVPDFLHGMRYALAHDRPDTVLWYWHHLAPYLWMHNRYQEFIECDCHALAAAERLAAAEPHEGGCLRARIRGQLAFAHLEVGELDLAADHLDAAEALWREAGQLGEVARVIRYRANLQCARGDWAGAEQLCRASLRVITAAERSRPDLSPPRHPVHGLLGEIALEQGDYRAARRELLVALSAARRLAVDRVYWCLAPMINLGRVHEQCGRPAQAQRYYRRCLALTEDGENRGLRADALIRLARLLAAHAEEGSEGRDRAARLAREALDLYTAMGKWSDQRRSAQLLETLTAPG